MKLILNSKKTLEYDNRNACFLICFQFCFLENCFLENCLILAMSILTAVNAFRLQDRGLIGKTWSVLAEEKIICWELQ